MSHTPGPWTAYGGGKHARPAVFADSGSICVLSTRRGNAYAETTERTLETAQADARLIAAAPTLLEIVKAFVAQEVDYMTRNKLGDPEQQHNVKWARAVIALVEGSEQNAGRDGQCRPNDN